MSRPRLLVLTQLYRPEPNFITADVAETMGESMDVVVVTAHPNYPFGKFYPNTRWWLPRRTVENGVTVWRLPMYPDHSLSNVQRGLSFLSFAIAASLFAPFVAGRPAVVWVYHGIFTTGIASLWFKFVTRSRIVFTCADLWPECFVASGVSKHPVMLKLLFAYRRFINRQADELICSTRGTMNTYAADGIAPSRLKYVPVWVEGIQEAPQPVENGASDKRIVYAGNIGAAQKLDTLIRVAGRLRHERPELSVHLYGTGTEEPNLKNLAASLNATNVTFHGRVPPETAFQAAASAFAQYVALQSSPLFRMTIPSKLGFSFAAGAPVLVGVEGESAELARESGGSFLFDPDDDDSLLRAIQQLLALSEEERATLRTRLRDYYRHNFARSALLEQYVAILGPGGQAARPGFRADLIRQVAR